MSDISIAHNYLIWGNSRVPDFFRDIINTAIRNGESLIITDPGGEFYREKSAELISRGYTVRQLNLSNPSQSCHWNPLLELEGDPEDYGLHLLCRHIMDRTEPDENTEKTARLLSCLILSSIEEPEERCNLYEIERLASRAARDEEEMFRAIRNAHPGEPKKAYFRIDDDEIGGEDIKKVSTHLRGYLPRELLSILTAAEVEIDLSKPRYEKCAYFITRKDFDEMSDNIFYLFLEFLYYRLDCPGYDTDAPKIPTHILLHGFDEMKQIPQLYEKLLSSIEQGVSTYIPIDRISMLQHEYPNTWDKLIEICTTVSIHG